MSNITQSKVAHIMNDRVTDAVAVGAVATTVAPPDWIAQLAGISQSAVTLTPILGAVWLVMQIVFKLHEVYTRRQDRLMQREKERRDAARSAMVSRGEEVHRTQRDSWPEA